MSIFL
jgi:hypothetical protein